MTSQAEKRCLDCDGTLEVSGVTEQCKKCGGSLVSEAHVLSMYLQMRDNAHLDALPLEAVSSAEEPRGCPGCETLMVRVLLEGVEIDFCRTHGFWFDPNEFQQVLQSAGDSKPDQTKVSFWRGLLDMFVFVERREAKRHYRSGTEDPWLWLKDRK